MCRRKYDWQQILTDYKIGMNPDKLAGKYGCNPAHIHYILTHSGVTPRTVDQTRNPDGYRKLIRTNRTSPTRIVSIPGRYLTALGVNPKHSLKGKWLIADKRLVLEVQET